MFGSVWAEGKSVRAGVSVTGSIVSVTIDHCLWCQFRLSPWKRQSKVQSKTSLHKQSLLLQCLQVSVVECSVNRL